MTTTAAEGRASSASHVAQDEASPLLPIPPLRKAPTPLPKIQLGILLLIQFAEPISGTSIYPYINQLVGELEITGGDERKVGYYAGLIVSCDDPIRDSHFMLGYRSKDSLFFVTQSIAVIHWSRLSDRIGRKPVILIGLSGLCVSMTCFGLSKTFWQLVVRSVRVERVRYQLNSLSRCICGLLNGNVGAVKSMIGELTDSTNIAQAFALMPIGWSVGSTLG